MARCYFSDFDGMRSYLKNMVDKNWPQVRFYPGEATYLAWMDMRSIGRGEKMAEFFTNDRRSCYRRRDFWF